MGILRLLPYIRDRCGHVIRPLHDLEVFRGRKVWVDVPGLLYRFTCGLEAEDAIGVSNRVLALHERFESSGLRPVYVFDSTPPPEKKDLLLQRNAKRNHRKKALLQWEDKKRRLLQFLQCLDAERGSFALGHKCSLTMVAKQLTRSQASIPPDCVVYLQAKLKAREALWRLSRGGDAEEEAAKAARSSSRTRLRDKPDVVLSEDTDALVFGAPLLLLGYPAKNKAANSPMGAPGTPYTISLHELRESLGFQDGETSATVAHKRFVDFAILCGCDFAKRLPRIGPVKAHRIIQQYGSIGKFKLSREGCLIPNEVWMSFDYKAARRIFLRQRFYTSGNYAPPEVC